MNILALIPARYASTRLPAKPLADIGGKSMIQRVYEQAKKATLLTEVYVATDDQRIYDHVLGFGGQAIMTSTQHQSGTERCAEAIRLLNHPADIVVNIQGDEPFIQPAQINELVALFKDENVELATLIKKIEQQAELFDTSIPKVVLNNLQDALYFSRACIPFLRNVDEKDWLQHHTFYKHIGLYGYRTAILKKIVTLPTGILEQVEKLEQLRWLEHGFNIRTGITHHESLSIDTSQDLEKARAILSA